MLPIIQRELRDMQTSLCGYQYNLDHTECISQIVVKIAGRSVHGRFILDKKNFYNSSCTRQPARVNDLYQAGCELRVRKPLHGGFSCMHVKCLIIDQKTVLTGSVNLTHNGLENNKEHLFLMTEPPLAAAVLADLEREWLIAEPIADLEISLMLDMHRKRHEQQRSNNAKAVQSQSSSLGSVGEGSRHP
jgi:phosphatidylserine/phosphatidylglycerophosphate/cardiolipin synthase-like enzyme